MRLDDVLAGVVHVVHTLNERDDGTFDDGSSTDSEAGVRSVAMPALILPDVAARLAEYTEQDGEASAIERRGP